MLALVVAGPAVAAAASRPTPIAVDFAPAGSDSWYVSGLEELVARELSRFAALELAEKLPSDRCPDRAPRCLVEQYRAAGVPLLVLGHLQRRVLAFAVYST